MVRDATTADAAAVLRVLELAFAEYDGRLDPPSGVRTETLASLEAKLASGAGLVAVSDGEVVGCAFAEQRRDYLYVGRFGVVPAARGERVGDLLLAAAEARARALGVDRVRLFVRLVLDGLRSYYESRGYRPIAEHAHDGYAGPTYVEMEKTLEPREESE
jgi:predicted N-acetyltransferase YhbS